MLRATTAKLWSEGPKGVLDPVEVSGREVYCTIRSVGMREMYEALSHGLRPELVVDLAHDFEYQGEQFCEVGGVEYTIIRTYINENDGIELTLQRRGETA